MKTQFNALNKYFSILYKRLAVSSNWRRAFMHERSLIGYLDRLPIILLGKSSRSVILSFVAFSRFALPMVKSSGFKGLALYLKVCNTLLVKAIAGSPVKGVFTSLGHRVSVTRSGIPKCIPRIHRREILANNVFIIRFWLSLFSIYRVLDFFGKPNLSTITKPGLSFDMSCYETFVPEFMKWLSSFHKIRIQEPTYNISYIQKSGPGVLSHKKVGKSTFKGVIKPVNTTAALLTQLLALKSDPILWKAYTDVAMLTRAKYFYTMVLDTIKWANITLPKGSKLTPEFLGKLGIKEEPGKVRVFAMVDWWTQMLLKPIHLAIFELLSKLPTDATMDQDRAVEKGRKMLAKYKFAASYDLSAATDRLPVSLQSILISALFEKPRLGQAWRDLLVSRPYALPKSIRGLGMKIPKSIVYEVGQPMGALSSWAMLALTHHFIVQLAAYLVGHRTFFHKYLVLGDDIVIFDRSVASQYLILMKDLGVGINLVKSVISTRAFEFAKRIITLESDCSPVSFKEMDVASSNLDGLMQLISRFRGNDWPVASLAKFSGAKYRVLSHIGGSIKSLSRYWANLVIYSNIPGRRLGNPDTWLDWFGLKADKAWVLVDLQSLKDKFLYWLSIRLPSRLSCFPPKYSSGHGIGLRPDSKGTLRYPQLYQTVYNGKISLSAEKLLACINRILGPITSNRDRSLLDMDKAYKEIKEFQCWGTPEEASWTLNEYFQYIELMSATSQKEVNLMSPPKEELPSKTLAPQLLRMFNSFKSK